jgi:hypothetical protein
MQVLEFDAILFALTLAIQYYNSIATRLPKFDAGAGV